MATTGLACRFCGASIHEVFADLGMSPLANSFLSAEEADGPETFYPLRALVCDECKLVQVGEFESPQHIFSDYLYFSSFSSSWVDHCRRYAHSVAQQLALGPRSQVVELASNDGYLLQFFQSEGIPVRGVEPAANVAEVAKSRGIPTVVDFFGRTLATSMASEAPADLIIANNVLAHVPDLNDFVAGVRTLLSPSGVFTMEFPHLLQLIDGRQWDTIYHEHFSYFSLTTARRVFAAHGLTLFDVEELDTHGGSLRIYGCLEENRERSVQPRLTDLIEQEGAAGMDELDTYRQFGERVCQDKWQVQETLIDLVRQGLRIAGYGAPAKANTLLNYCAIGRDVLEYTCDQNPHKQGLVLPGTHVPIRAPDAITEDRPDIVFILPWNLREEIMGQLAHVREWGGRFLARTPELRLLP
jgi:SAM-dependent methyltransferase